MTHRTAGLTESGPARSLLVPAVPTVAVTGTNGKTTVTRLVAHIGRCAGLRVGWCNTDGIYLDGELVEPGDWAGPGGARRVLTLPGIELAVLETAQGGIRRRGVGVAHYDVAVVTNVSADHLGGGVDTLDQLADVKATIVRFTRPSGCLVLNAEDPRVLSMRRWSRADPFLFALDPKAPGLRDAQRGGGRSATVINDELTVLEHDQVNHLLPVVEAPITLAGTSRCNVANALAAVAAGHGAGLPRRALIDALRTFLPGPGLNPGRLNIFDLAGRTVIIDRALNPGALHSLLEVCHSLRAPGKRIRIVVGTGADRTDELIRSLGELAARRADQVVIGEKERNLRLRGPGEMTRLFRAGAAAAGVTDVPVHPTELVALGAIVAEAVPGDVSALMCHAERDEVFAWLGQRGATLLGPAELRGRASPPGGDGAIPPGYSALS